MVRDRPARACCTSPQALCLCAAVFAIIYGIAQVGRAAWPVLDGYSETLLLTALGVACLVNFGRNRTFHCAITGPVFLVAAIMAGLAESGVWGLNLSLLWGLVLVGVGIAALLEWRMAGSGLRRLNGEGS